MSYRKIEPRMWDDERFAALSPEAKLTWLCILTGPHTTALPGLSVCGVASLAEAIRYGIDTVSKALHELCAAGLVKVNLGARVILVPNAPKYNPCPNVKVLKGWLSLWKNVPDCAEKYAYIKHLRAALDFSQEWSATAWGQTFDTVSVPYRYGIDTVSNSVTVSETETVPPSGGVGGATLGETAPQGSGAKGQEGSPRAEKGQTATGVAGNPSNAPKGPSSFALEPPSEEPPKAPKPAKAPKAPKAPPPADAPPLVGTLAHRVYSALVGDRVLCPITVNPGDFAARIADPETYPGVDVLAEVRKAAEYASGSGKTYTDGRAYLRNWLNRRAQEVARQPRPATPAIAASPAPPPPVVPRSPPPTQEDLNRSAAAAREIGPKAQALFAKIAAEKGVRFGAR